MKCMRSLSSDRDVVMVECVLVVKEQAVAASLTTDESSAVLFFLLLCRVKMDQNTCKVYTAVCVLVREILPLHLSRSLFLPKVEEHPKNGLPQNCNIGVIFRWGHHLWCLCYCEQAERNLQWETDGKKKKKNRRCYNPFLTLPKMKTLPSVLL